MSDFNRGLNEEFVEALNAEYRERHSWWRPFVDDDQLFLAVREGYVNVYHCGGSILELKRPYGRWFKGKVHHEYLGKKEPSGNPYIPVEQDELGSLRVADLKKKVKERWARYEKGDVHQVVQANRGRILDVEIHVPGAGSQVDLAMIFDGCLRFYEAKVASNGCLVSQGPTPRVVDQIRRYAESIAANGESIVNSYQKVISNLTALRGVRDRHPERHRLLEAVSGKLTVDPFPWLVITGASTNRNWGDHLKKLKSQLKGRVICIDDPADQKATHQAFDTPASNRDA